MTLAERLAREALPCENIDRLMRQCQADTGRPICTSCQRRPAVVRAIEKAIEACSDVVNTTPIGMYTSAYVLSGAIENRVRRLLTDEVQP